MNWISREFPMKSSQRQSWIREWWRHHSGRKAGGCLWNDVKICGNGDEFEISNSIWIYLDFAYRGFLLEPEVGKDFSFFDIKKIFSDVFRWCEAVPVFEDYAIPHAISCHLQNEGRVYGYTSAKSHSYDGKEPAKIWGSVESFQRFQVNGQDITERLKALMAMS